MENITRRFEIGNWIASGSFGKIYKGKDKKTKETIAIKIVPKSGCKKHEVVWQNEWNTLSRLSPHPNIVEVIQLESDEISLYYVFELMDEDLFQTINRKDNEKAKLGDPLYYVKEIAKGIQYMHKNGVTHRDIKPENILVKGTGPETKSIVKITDFGHSIFQLENITGFIGSTFYVAREILEKIPYNYTVDIWALGILYYELITKFPPFYNDGSDNEVYKKIIANKVDYTLVPKQHANNIRRILQPSPILRPSLEEILSFDSEKLNDH